LRQLLTCHRERLAFFRERLAFFRERLAFFCERLAFFRERLAFFRERLAFFCERLAFFCERLAFFCERLAFFCERLAFFCERGSNPRCGFEHGVLRFAQNSGSNCRLRQLLIPLRGSEGASKPLSCLRQPPCLYHGFGVYAQVVRCEFALSGGLNRNGDLGS
jgi:hypothetical protein